MVNKTSQLTIYKNELNSVPLRKFNSVEMNLFFTICTKMREKGLQTIKLDFEELKILSQYDRKSNIRFIGDLRTTYNKLLSLKYSRNYLDNQNKDIEEYFILFTGFKINKTDEYVEIKTNPDLRFIINAISSEFTKFELQEFTNLRSSYSKTAFRLLKQFRLTGFWKVNIDDFRNLLDIPITYSMDAVNKRVLKPIKNELSLVFKNLKIEKIKAKKKNKIEYLEFSFTPQDDIRKDGTKTFKDKNKGYYENDIEHFTREEINKAFPKI